MSDAGSEIDAQEQAPTIGTYEGDRAATGERHGKGRNTFPNGDVYEGDYFAGRREGRGIYTWKKPRARYVGGYLENLRHGPGAMVYPDGSRYKGDFKAGKRHGKGIYIYVNGDWYDGMWENNVKHGEGVYTFAATKSTISGTWDKNWLAGPAEIKHADHQVRGSFVPVRETVPVNPDDEAAGTMEVVVDSKLTLPCALQFASTGYNVPVCRVPQQVGLGVPVPAGEDEGK
ncbi:Radial spoke head 1 [Allomyces arbusculus]|nr:Radial spoke head 1 [Allomyces arbusculus]